MEKQTAKLISITLMMVLSLCLMTVSSYAWLVLSKNPVVSGIAVTVGGSDTIKLAPNISEVTQTGEVVNYPGFFTGSLQLDGTESLKAIKPVSTTDGINWVFPENIENKAYTYNPGIVIKDEKSLQDDNFIHDSRLEYGNLSVDSEKESRGSYLYFDFWAVSPARDCILRVSTGEDDGSYVINMPVVEKTDDGYVLNTENTAAAAYTRVGFLVNTDTQVNNSMNEYVAQPQYNEAYKKLKGIYREKGEDGNIASKTTYTVYEPNCDWHPVITGAGIYTNVGVLAKGVTNGDYVVTSPLERMGNIYILGDLDKRVTAQKTTRWKTEDAGITVQSLFDRYIESLGETVEDYSRQQLTKLFYENRLKAYSSRYLSIGQFMPNTTALYAAAQGDLGIQQYVPEKDLTRLGEAGATKDVDIVYLERNVPQRIRMYVYLEGQDVDCVSSNEITNLIVHLELAGGSRIK